MSYTDDIGAYIRRIRNKHKRNYALTYYLYKRGRNPKPDIDNLSVMAQQAVRMNIDSLLEQKTGGKIK